MSNPQTSAHYSRFEIEHSGGSPLSRSPSQRYPQWGVNRFPDGQVQFWLRPVCGKATYGLTCSIINSEDLDLFIQIINTVPLDSVTVKYLYGARSDKDKADDLIVANLPRIIQHAIESSPNHSEVCAYTFWNPHCELYIKHDRVVPYLQEMMGMRFDGLIFPDESAQNRMADACVVFKCGQYFTCEKVRDQITGKIVSHKIPEVIGDKFLILDDLCDGGKSFLNIAEQLPGKQLYLYVTHGVFSNGARQKLEAVYERVWCTDSYPSLS